MTKSVEVISISGAGHMTSMHSDSGILNKLGAIEVERATEILHDSDTGKWYIDPREAETRGTGSLRDAQIPLALIGFDGYELARAMEVCWVKLCHLEGVSFRTDTTVCVILRTIFDDLLNKRQCFDELLIPLEFMSLACYKTGVPVLQELKTKLTKVTG